MSAEEAQQKADAAMYGWKIAAELATIRMRSGKVAQPQIQKQSPAVFLMQSGGMLQVIPKQSPQPQPILMMQPGSSLQVLPKQMSQADLRAIHRANEDAYRAAGSPAIITYRPFF
jgi:hypothetical protein